MTTFLLLIACGIVGGLLFFFLGLYVFKRHQDKFVLYL